MMLVATLGWFFAFHLSSDNATVTSHMAFNYNDATDAGIFVVAFFAVLIGAFGLSIAIGAFDEKYFVTTLIGAVIVGVNISMFLPLSNPSALTLSSWAEQRYGIQLDDNSIQSLGKLHDGGLLATDGQTMIVTLHSGQEGFLLYDSKNQQELPLKVITK